MRLRFAGVVVFLSACVGDPAGSDEAAEGSGSWLERVLAQWETMRG